MDLSEPAFELQREAAEEFAALVDYFRHYRDCTDLYTETQKFGIRGIASSHRQPQVSAMWSTSCGLSGFQPGGPQPLSVTVLYLVP